MSYLTFAHPAWLKRESHFALFASAPNEAAVIVAAIVTTSC